MKKVGIISLLSLFLILTGSVVSSQAKSIELRLDTLLSPGHFHYEALQEFADRVEKGTNGRVHITIFGANALADPKEVWKELQVGIVDMTNFLGNYQTSGFELEKISSAFTYGMSVDNFLKLREDLWREYPPVSKEYADAKVLSRAYGGVFKLFTVDKPVRVPGDLKGQSVRVNMPLLITLVNENRGVGIGGMPMSECYVGLEKKIISGIITMDSPLKSFKLAEILQYRTNIQFGSNLTGWTTAMNWDKWNSLPKDIQRVLEKAGAELSAKQTEGWLKSSDVGLEFGRQQGMKFIEPTPEQHKQWSDTLAKMANRVAAEYDAKGIKATEFMKKINEFKKRYAAE
jgi:TRAP-type C4-dicarboxylate transport system substrate-binding protein